LVVDEDATDLADYSALLEAEGYDVRASTSYIQALDWLGSQRFDFVIVSQGSREFEGRAVLERAVEIDRRVPVLVLARSVDMGCYIEAMHLGALDYFEKPMMPQELLRLVNSHLPAGTQLRRTA
jgi:two-component system C4-dicarboxylate transport response regulator DctD